MFRRGDTGMAVGASSSVPGVFQPVSINGREYVDGGLVSLVPVRVAKSLGADIVIAVDISAKPRSGKIGGTFHMLLQTFSIVGQSISNYELAQADVVLRPANGDVAPADFQARHLAILKGEQAVKRKLPEIRAKIAQFLARQVDWLRSTPAFDTSTYIPGKTPGARRSAAPGRWLRPPAGKRNWRRWRVPFRSG